MKRPALYKLLLWILLLHSFALRALPLVNRYELTREKAYHAFVDTVYDDFKTYFARLDGPVLSGLQPFDNTSYRLTKHMVQVVDYVNHTDSALAYRFYSPVYRYAEVAQVVQLDDDRIVLRPSAQVRVDKQFFSVSLPAGSVLRLALVYQPISFKDYTDHEKTVFKYLDPHDPPVPDRLTGRRNQRFAVEYLFIIGMIFLMFIFYIIAYYYLRDKIYLYYTFYLVVTFAQITYMLQYILSRNLKMYNIVGNSAVDEATKGLMIFFYSIFYKQAFRVNRRSPALYYCIEALKYISLLYVLIVIAGNVLVLPGYFEPLFYFLYRFPIFFFSLIILFITYGIADKSLFQRYIFLGSVLYTLFTAVSTLLKLDIPVPNDHVSVNILYLGVALELIFFSIALIIRIKDSFISSEKLKDELIVRLKENEQFIKTENTVLEQKVSERVEELRQKDILIEQQHRNALIQAFEKEKLEIQQMAMAAQMNPHFIFNCMNSIQHFIVTGNTEKASQVLHDFASLIRMVLEYSAQPDILLQNEIILLDTYLKLERERTNNGFDYEIVVDPAIAVDFIRIPNMMLQPFLENAIFHGFRAIDYPGKIEVRFFATGMLVCCRITDNGIGRKLAMDNKLPTSSRGKRSLAIGIIESRIALLNKTEPEQRASLSITDLSDRPGEPAGTVVTICLPVI